jgi:hypothetical protein
MPSGDGRIVGHLEGIVDACVEHGETSTLDILHQVEVVLLTCKSSVNGCLFGTR